VTQRCEGLRDRSQGAQRRLAPRRRRRWRACGRRRQAHLAGRGPNRDTPDGEPSHFQQLPESWLEAQRWSTAGHRPIDRRSNRCRGV